ncbi:hypothetical protein FB545_1483 [Peribacillus frigoritolerans]|nr:hypothetical protein FB545_1483 [Peribacillus frigoritolerans]
MAPSQFVDKRGSELKNCEPLLKFPLNFRLKLRDWGSTSPHVRPFLDLAMSNWPSSLN